MEETPLHRLVLSHDIRVTPILLSQILYFVK